MITAPRQVPGTKLKCCRLLYTTTYTGKTTLLSCYAADTIGLHRVENHTHTDPAISLHLYCPPIEVCQSFEERTGVSHKCRVTFFHSTPENN